MSSRPRLAARSAGCLGLADAGRTGEEVAADRLFRISQPGAGELDRRGELGNRLVLTVHGAPQRLQKRLQHLGVVFGDRLRRDASHGGDGRLDLFHADRLLALGLGQEHLRGARLVDHVDRLIRQLPVVNVARRQLDRGLDCLAGVAKLVELLEIGLEALEDLDGVGDARLLDIDLLEPADERAVLLEILPIFLVGGRADAT